jgi:hypothetical protein
MTIALDIINRALSTINVLGDGETATAAQAQDALDALNDVLEGWSTENLMVYVPTKEQFNLISGQAEYTIGVGGDFNTARPDAITFAFTRLNGVDFPLQLWTYQQYDSISLKSLTGSIPSVLYYEPSYPLGRIRIWCAPDSTAHVLHIESLKPFSRLATLDAVIALPPGYERALRYALAQELMAEYGTASPLVIELAKSSKADLKRRNFVPIVMGIDGMIPRGKQVFTIYERF